MKGGLPLLSHRKKSCRSMRNTVKINLGLRLSGGSVGTACFFRWLLNSYTLPSKFSFYSFCFSYIIDDYAHVTIPFGTGMPKTVGPQALFRCIPAKACAENHQVPVTFEGTVSCFGLPCYLDFGDLKLICMCFIGNAEVLQELRGHGRIGGSSGHYVRHDKICQWFNASNCHHWLWGICMKEPVAIKKHV